MSCYMCPDKTFATIAIAHVLLQERRSLKDLAVSRAETLRLTNKQSIDCRYGAKGATMYPAEPEPFAFGLTDFDRVAKMLRDSPGEVARECSTYDYQACEYEHWESCEAHTIIQQVRLELLARLPGY